MPVSFQHNVLTAQTQNRTISKIEQARRVLDGAFANPKEIFHRLQADNQKPQLLWPVAATSVVTAITAHQNRRALICAAFSEHFDALQILCSLDEAVRHRFLGRAQRHTGVIIFLVGLLRALRVADLALKVVVVLGLFMESVAIQHVCLLYLTTSLPHHKHFVHASSRKKPTNLSAGIA